MTDPAATPKPARSWTVRFGFFSCAALAFGLLLWARLIVVTNHPRTAIAEPPQPPTTHDTSALRPLEAAARDAAAHAPTPDRPLAAEHAEP